MPDEEDGRRNAESGGHRKKGGDRDGKYEGKGRWIEAKEKLERD